MRHSLLNFLLLYAMALYSVDDDKVSVNMRESENPLCPDQEMDGHSTTLWEDPSPVPVSGTL